MRTTPVNRKLRPPRRLSTKPAHRCVKSLRLVLTPAYFGFYMPHAEPPSHANQLRFKRHLSPRGVRPDRRFGRRRAMHRSGRFCLGFRPTSRTGIVSAFSFPARVSALLEPKASKRTGGRSAEGGDVGQHHTSCRQKLWRSSANSVQLWQSPSLFGDLRQAIAFTRV